MRDDDDVAVSDLLPGGFGMRNNNGDVDVVAGLLSKGSVVS